MRYILTYDQQDFIEKLQNISLQEERGLVDNLIVKILRYFENEAFFCEWGVYDNTFPRDFSREEVKIIQLCTGWSSWSPEQKSIQDKINCIAVGDIEELYLSALDGDVQDGGKLFDIYLGNNKKITLDGLDQAFLKKSALLKVLIFLKKHSFLEEKILHWALCFKICSPSLDCNYDTLYVWKTLCNIEFYKKNKIKKNDEIKRMIDLMSLPEEKNSELLDSL